MLSVILSVWDASPKPKLLNGRVFPEKKTELHNPFPHRFPPFLPPLVPLPFFFPSEGNTPLPKPSDGERCKLSRRVQAEPGH